MGSQGNRVAIVGTGVIDASGAAFFLAQGFDVVTVGAQQCRIIANPRRRLLQSKKAPACPARSFAPPRAAVTSPTGTRG